MYQQHSVGCIIMASGHSRRFGENKLLKTAEGKPLICHVLDAIPEAMRSDTMVVTRYEAVRVLAEQRGFRVIMHDLPDQSDTLKAGLSRRNIDWRGCLFITADQPRLRRETIERMLQAFAKEPNVIWRLSCKGRQGSPVLFPRPCFEQLMQLTGDTGGRQILKSGRYTVKTVETDREEELMDIDEPEDFERCFRSESTEK